MQNTLKGVLKWAAEKFQRAVGAERSAALAGYWRRFESFSKFVADDPTFGRVVIGAILLNALLLGLASSRTVMSVIGGLVHLLDGLILALFTFEIIVRIVAHRGAFFRSGWSLFDFFAVAASYIPNTGGVAILRTLRLFRVLRIMSVVPALRRVISSFFTALPSMVGVLGALAVIFYVSAVITTNVFGQTPIEELRHSPTPEDVALMRELYGTLGHSFFTLFQLMTLENWVDGIVAPTMRVYPSSLVFFIPYIVLTSFAILNLFIGVIVEAMAADEREEEEARDEAQTETLETVLAEVKALRQDVAELRSNGPSAPDGAGWSPER